MTPRARTLEIIASRATIDRAGLEIREKGHD